MQTVDVHAAKTHLSRLVEAAAGNDIVVARYGKPVARPRSEAARDSGCTELPVHAAAAQLTPYSELVRLI